MNPMSEGAQSPWLEEGLRRLSWRSGEEETYSWCAPPPSSLQTKDTFGERTKSRAGYPTTGECTSEPIMDSSVAAGVA